MKHTHSINSKQHEMFTLRDTLTEDECLRYPAFHLSVAVHTESPSLFTSGMVAENFKYELPSDKTFLGKHMLDKDLFELYLAKAINALYRDHCLFIVFCNYKVLPLFFLVYSSKYKKMIFRYRVIRVEYGPNIRKSNNILGMRELSWGEARKYYGFVMDNLLDLHGDYCPIWKAGAFICERYKRKKTIKKL